MTAIAEKNYRDHRGLSTLKSSFVSMTQSERWAPRADDGQAPFRDSRLDRTPQMTMLSDISSAVRARLRQPSCSTPSARVASGARM
jgi:hypothetical protein